MLGDILSRNNMSRELEKVVEKWLERKKMIERGSAGYTELRMFEEEIESVFNRRSRRKLADHPLDELSEANLKAGRITRDAMALAMVRAKLDRSFVPENVGCSDTMSTVSDMILADVLNDMFTAAKDVEDAPVITEKARRVYYQNIVYQVCSWIERIQGKHVRNGEGVVCGAVEAPSNEVELGMTAIFHRIETLKSEIEAYKNCEEHDVRCATCIHDTKEGRIPSNMYDAVVTALKLAQKELKGERVNGDWQDTIEQVDKVVRATGSSS